MHIAQHEKTPGQLMMQTTLWNVQVLGGCHGIDTHASVIGGILSRP